MINTENEIRAIYFDRSMPLSKFIDIVSELNDIDDQTVVVIKPNQNGNLSIWNQKKLIGFIDFASEKFIIQQ